MYVGRAALALDGRPAVVVALVDQVQLVERVLAELGGPQPPGVVERQPLHVAVPPRPHGGVGVGVAGRRVAVGGDPQDLAAQRAAVLGEGGLAGLAGGGVEVAVRPERQPAAVVDEAVGDPVEDRLGSAPAACRRTSPARCGCPRASWRRSRAGGRFSYVGETATPSSPASPCGSGLVDVPISVTSSSVTASTRRVSRSVTTAVPSGRKSMPHGASRPVAMVADHLRLAAARSGRRLRGETASAERGAGAGRARRSSPARSGAAVVVGRAGGQGQGESERQRGEPHALRL